MRISMNNLMEYKGYVGTVEFSEEDRMLYGKVIGICTLISYEGASATELVEDFHGAVDEYLAVCDAEGIRPEKAYKGSFNIRISPELHKRAALCAMDQHISLNKFVENAVVNLLDALRV